MAITYEYNIAQYMVVCSTLDVNTYSEPSIAGIMKQHKIKNVPR